MVADPASRKLSVDSFLRAPNRTVKRVLQYFAEIVNNTEETNRDHETLQKAMDEHKEIVSECDARYPSLVNNVNVDLLRARQTRQD